jgi:hypothetical protein
VLGIDSGEDALREPTLRTATAADLDAIRGLIAASVRGLQHEYSEGQREQALASVFTPDTQLISDGSYFILETAEGSVVETPITNVLQNVSRLPLVVHHPP